MVGVIVEIAELQLPDDEFASGEYEGTQFSNRLEFSFIAEDPIDADCPTAGKCIGLLTRVRRPGTAGEGRAMNRAVRTSDGSSLCTPHEIYVFGQRHPLFPSGVVRASVNQKC